MKPIILFKTDPWHSNDSRELMGVFDRKFSALRALRENGATREQIEEIFNQDYHQSQLNNMGYEFELDPVEMNENLLSY